MGDGIEINGTVKEKKKRNRKLSSVNEGARENTIKKIIRAFRINVKRENTYLFLAF
jgi:hypothetical protein